MRIARPNIRLHLPQQLGAAPASFPSLKLKQYSFCLPAASYRSSDAEIKELLWKMNLEKALLILRGNCPVRFALASRHQFQLTSLVSSEETSYQPMQRAFSGSSRLLTTALALSASKVLTRS
jgi:hypothetical protein